MVSRPEQGADNGGWHRRRCRLGLQAPVDDMGGTGELQRKQQHRPWREDPLPSPHCVSRMRQQEEGEMGRFWTMDGEKTRQGRGLL